MKLAISTIHSTQDYNSYACIAARSLTECKTEKKENAQRRAYIFPSNARGENVPFISIFILFCVKTASVRERVRLGLGLGSPQTPHTY